MIRIDGTMIVSKFANGIIQTAKDPFLPMAVNVAGKDAEPEWHPVRVYGSAEQLANLAERATTGGNLLVRGGVSIFKRVSEKDGQHYADVVFNTNAARLEVYDRDAKGFRKLADVLGEPTPAAPAKTAKKGAKAA